MEVKRFLVFNDHKVIMGFTSLRFKKSTFHNDIYVYLGSISICNITDYKSIKVTNRMANLIYYTVEF